MKIRLTRWTFATGCERAAIGHAITLPKTVMNSRRSIDHLTGVEEWLLYQLSSLAASEVSLMLRRTASRNLRRKGVNYGPRDHVRGTSVDPPIPEEIAAAPKTYGRCAESCHPSSELLDLPSSHLTIVYRFTT